LQLKTQQLESNICPDRIRQFARGRISGRVKLASGWVSRWAGGEAPMTATNEFEGIVGTILTEIKELNEEINLVPKIITKLNGSSSVDLEFRPLTEEEKKEFVNSLDAKGKRLLAELAGRPKRSPRRKLSVVRDQTSAFGNFGSLNFV